MYLHLYIPVHEEDCYSYSIFANHLFETTQNLLYFSLPEHYIDPSDHCGLSNSVLVYIL